MKSLKKLLSVVISCIMCFTSLSALQLNAEETVENHSFISRPTDLHTYYNINNGVITEITNYTDAVKTKVTIIQVIQPNGLLMATVQNDGITIGTYQNSNVDYSIFYNAYLNQYLPSLTCNLSDSTYRHSFVESSFEEYPHNDILDAIADGSGGVAILIGAFLGVTGGTLASIASWLFSLWNSHKPYASQLILNVYDVFYKSNGNYYTICWHINDIHLDSGGHVISGGGMNYVQPNL